MCRLKIPCILSIEDVYLQVALAMIFVSSYLYSFLFVSVNCCGKLHNIMFNLKTLLKSEISLGD